MRPARYDVKVSSVQVEIEFLTPDNLSAHIEGLIAAYHATYVEPPYNESLGDAQDFGENILKSAHHAGFRCVVARHLPDKRIVGLASGSACLSGGWWRDAVTQGLSQAVIERWFSSAFEFVELGVIPPFQGQGIGRRLHQAILADLDYRTAVLNVLQADIPAVHLYRQQGWVPIRQDFVYHAGDCPCTIMGLDLVQFKAGISGTQRVMP